MAILFRDRSVRIIFAIFLFLFAILTVWQLRVLVSAPCPQHGIHRHAGSHLPTVYVITPTYYRLTQKADLTRLASTLRHVRSLHWIIVEDANYNSALVRNLVEKTAMSYDLLHKRTPDALKLAENERRWKKPRGAYQRNHGIHWLRTAFVNRPKYDPPGGVVYFADDDNTYDLELFDEMRYTRKVSIWPVGLVGGLLWEGPICQNDKVIGWKTGWKPERPYPIDMAGFAVSLDLLLKNQNASFSGEVPRGFQESFFLKQLIDGVDQLEAKADNCSKVFVWHTRTENPKIVHEEKLTKEKFVDIEI